MTWTNSLGGLGAKLSGKAGEQQAQRFLESNGLTLVERNFHCRKGELDLVMRDSEQWVFVEVKFRNSGKFADTEAAFHSAKRKKVEAAIAYFMQQHDLHPDYTACRIDLVAITGNHVEWYKNV